MPRAPSASAARKKLALDPRRRDRVARTRRAIDGDARAIDVAELAVLGGLEGADPRGVGLGDVARGVELLVKGDHRAEAAQAGIGGQTDGGGEVARAVAVALLRQPLRAGEHHRFVGGHEQIGHEGALLHRVGAMGNDHARDVRTTQVFLRPARERERFRQAQRVAPQIEELHDLDLQCLRQAVKLRDQLRTVRHRADVAMGGVAAGRDGAPGADNDDLCHGEFLRRGR